MPAQSLRNTARAAAAAAVGEAEAPTLPAGSDIQPDEQLPTIEYTNPIAEVAQVAVQVALARVMADVQSVHKGDERNDVGGRYRFRGVDRVVNAVRPALRRHGVLVLPTRVFDVEYRETRTKAGNVMQECTLKVEWLVIGPKGDKIEHLMSVGQANDTGDKATSKAFSVAQRVLFLGALHIPTEDPTIDHGHDRGEQPLPSATDYRDEIVNPRTSLGRLQQIRGELRRLNMGGATATNEVGDEEALYDMAGRIGRERTAAGDPS